ncbi:hypothetical protein TWF694_011077 [Orbilia ellipsospora]|uniref:Glutaredoxin-like protein n=1 Tax=Orbilia ellipsospora TaxID=2528407 RepID=A0AAV9X7Y2_9PEZI
MVRPSLVLRSLRLTLFTKSDCGLCVKAKESVQNFRKSNSSTQYNEIDIMKTGNEKWHDAYVFDVPVLHLENSSEGSRIIKLMHRFSKEDIESKIMEL